MPQGTFLFIGDYLINEYDWQKRMPLFDVHSHGYSKDSVEELLSKLPYIEESASNPHIILIIAGIINVVDQDYTFVDQIRRMVIRLSNIFPESEIIVNSLPNIRVPFLVEDAIYHLNKDISLMASQTGCCYLDNFEILAKKDVNIFKQDGIHLTDASYDQWARSILEYVSFLHEDD